jgi:hypothetical protein
MPMSAKVDVARMRASASRRCSSSVAPASASRPATPPTTIAMICLAP